MIASYKKRPQTKMHRTCYPNTPIRFLSIQQATHHIHLHHQSYIDHTLQCSVNARLRSYDSVQSLCDHLVPWTTHQKHTITRVIRTLQQVCWSWKALLAGEAWTFVQVNDRLEDGMPHTIHSTIVLPVWMVKALCAEHPSTTHDRAVETLIHERIHVMQKLRRRWFDKLYKLWGFQRVDRADAHHRSTITRIHNVLSTRTNPDTPNQWVLRGRWYLFTHLRTNANTMRDADHYIVDLVDTPIESAGESILLSSHFARLEACDWYNTYYGHAEHCYHPDESSAVLLATWIAQDRRAEGQADDHDIRACEAGRVAVRWLNECY